MKDELTQPLGGTAARSSKILFWRRFAATGLVLAVLAAGYGAYLFAGRDAMSFLRQAESTPEPEAAPAAEAVAAKASPDPRGENQAVARPMVEVMPTGSIVPLEPLPEFERQGLEFAHLPDPDLVERISSGIIPRRSPDNIRPMDVYSRQPETDGNFGIARLVMIVGGLGVSQTGTQRAIRILPPGVTLAFAPYGNSLQRWMEEARKSGHELLLQIPMEPFDYPSTDPGRHTLRTDVDRTENIANLHWLMSRLSNYVGVINYLGGRFVTDDRALKTVFDELAARGLLFVDDGSVRNSRTDMAAQASLLPYAGVGFRVDTVRSREKILEKLDLAAKEAKRTGIAVAYADAFPESLEMMAAFARKAAADGIEITPVSAIVRDPERDR